MSTGGVVKVWKGLIGNCLQVFLILLMLQFIMGMPIPNFGLVEPPRRGTRTSYLFVNVAMEIGSQ